MSAGTLPLCSLLSFHLRSSIGATRQNETRDPLEFMCIEPGAMQVTHVDDHARSLAEVFAPHEVVARRTSAIFDAGLGRVVSFEARHSIFTALGAILCYVGSAIDQARKDFVRRPQSVAFRAFLNNKTTDFAHAHPALAAGAPQFRGIGNGRTRFEARATGETESRVIEIAGHALGADQSTAMCSANDLGATIAAVIVLPSRNRTTGAATQDRRLNDLRRTGLKRRATATFKGGAFDH